jgi:hypothetical protein
MLVNFRSKDGIAKLALSLSSIPGDNQMSPLNVPRLDAHTFVLGRCIYPSPAQKYLY